MVWSPVSLAVVASDFWFVFTLEEEGSFPCTVLGLKVQPCEVSFNGHSTPSGTTSPPPSPDTHTHSSFWFFLRSLPSLLRLEFPGTGCSLEPVRSLPAFPLPVGWGRMGGGPAGWSEVGLQP